MALGGSQLAQDLVLVLPGLAAVAPPLAAAILLTGTAAIVGLKLRSVLASRGQPRVIALGDLSDVLQRVIVSPDVSRVLSAQGYDSQEVAHLAKSLVVARIYEAMGTVSLPRFETPQQADSWFSQWTPLFLAGLLDADLFDRLGAHYNAELLRLGIQPLIDLTTPPVISTSLADIIAAEDAALAAARAGLEPDLASITPTSQLAAAPFIGPPIPAGLVTTVTPAAAAAAISPGQPINITVGAPSVNVAPPIVNVAAPNVTIAAPPAANLEVINNVDMSAILGGLSALPLALSQSMVGALSMSAQDMGHNMSLGRNRCYGTTAESLINVLTRNALPLLSIAALRSDVGIGGQLTRLAENFFAGALDPARYVTPASPETVFGTASIRLKEAMSFGLQAHMFGLTAEANFVTKNLGMGQVAGFMAELAGFDRLAMATMGQIEQAALSTPMRYLANKTYRPVIPGIGDLEEMYAKKEIPLEAREGVIGLRQALEYQGYSEEWIEIWKESLWRDPRLGEVIRIGQFFSPSLVPALSRPDSTTAEWMRRANIPSQYIDSPDWYYAWRAAKGGYDPRDVPILVETAKRATARREQTLFLDAVTRMSRDGYITEPRSRELIIEAWEFSDPIAARLKAIDLQRDYKLLTDSRSVIVMAMARGLITRDEARAQLTGLGLAPQRADLEVLKATLGMLPGMRLQISRPEEALEEAGMEAE